jgi:hypothetical protein
MTLTEVIIAALAVWQIVEIWHHSSLFASWRAKVETQQDRWYGELLLCPFCLSLWVAVLVTLGLVVLDYWHLGSVILGSFAVARLANLGNDLTHLWCRTPRNLLPPETVPSGAESSKYPYLEVAHDQEESKENVSSG